MTRVRCSTRCVSGTTPDAVGVPSAPRTAVRPDAPPLPFHPRSQTHQRRPFGRLWTVKECSPVEARGFEPRSETRFTTASTCVVHRLMSPVAGQWTAHPRTSSLKFRSWPASKAACYPEFAIPIEPPQEGFPMGRCSNAKRYAASARLSLAIEKSLEGFTRIRGPGHAATASLVPSKPVAPVL